MAVQYIDGSVGKLKPFHDALTEFLQKSEAVSLYKFENESEYKEFVTKTDAEQRLKRVEEKLDDLVKRKTISNILYIPTENDILKIGGVI